MKYLNFRSRASKSESITCKLLKVALRHISFSKNFTIIAKQWYWKMHQDGCFWWQIYFWNIPQWLLLKDSCKDILKFWVTHVLHFFLWRHVKEKRIFMNIFLSEGFGEKCNHSQLYNFPPLNINIKRIWFNLFL